MVKQIGTCLSIKLDTKMFMLFSMKDLNLFLDLEINVCFLQTWYIVGIFLVLISFLPFPNIPLSFYHSKDIIPLNVYFSFILFL